MTWLQSGLKLEASTFPEGGDRVPHHDVLADSSEINMATTSKAVNVKYGKGKQGKENTPPVTEKKDREVKPDCVFCEGVQHRFDVCPKAKLIRELDKMGVSSLDQIQVKSKESKVTFKQPAVNMYTLANSSQSDEYEIACMTVDDFNSEADIPDLVYDSSDDECESEKELQLFFTAPKVSSEKEKLEKVNLADMLRSGPYAGLDNM